MHNPIQALAIVVDHPPGVAQIMLPAFLKAFIYIAFIQLCIADQRDHPAQRALAGPCLGFEIILHQGGKGRDRHAETDRACGEVDIVHVFRTAGIGLCPAESAEVLQLLARLVTHHVLHGVENRGSVRLDRHPVLGPQRMEVKRRHDRHHRGAGGLMPTDLHIPVFLGAQMVGIVHNPRGQPQQTLFHGFQCGHIGHDRFALVAGRPGHRGSLAWND